VDQKLVGLIFDFDGLVVDTESAIFEAWRALYAAEGEELALSDYQQCVGSTFGAYDPMAVLEERLGRTPDWPFLLSQKDEAIRNSHLSLAPCAGITQILTEAQQCGIPCCVASSSSPDHVHGWVDRLGLRPFFHHLTCRGDEGARPKPAPDLFALAAKRLGLPPSQCLILEDSRNGLLAAQAAGIACVVIPSPVTMGSDFSGARAIWPSLEGQSTTDLISLLPLQPKVR
jgi:putative hydrolase of the HAD superfamily